jgi:hypothetical protein
MSDGISRRTHYSNAREFYQALAERRQKYLKVPNVIWTWNGVEYPCRYDGEHLSDGNTVYEVRYNGKVYNVPEAQIQLLDE